jgi:hypothetical protein
MIVDCKLWFTSKCLRLVFVSSVFYLNGTPFYWDAKRKGWGGLTGSTDFAKT